MHFPEGFEDSPFKAKWKIQFFRDSFTVSNYNTRWIISKSHPDFFLHIFAIPSSSRHEKHCQMLVSLFSVFKYSRNSCVVQWHSAKIQWLLIVCLKIAQNLFGTSTKLAQKFGISLKKGFISSPWIKLNIKISKKDRFRKQVVQGHVGFHWNLSNIPLRYFAIIILSDIFVCTTKSQYGHSQSKNS